MVEFWADWLAVSDCLDRRRPGGGRLGELDRCCSGSATACSSSAMTLSSPIRAAGARHPESGRERILVKPNQIGTLTETLDAIALAQRNGMRGHLPSQWRNRRHLHRRSRGGDECRADQDRRPVARRSGRQVQPASSRSRPVYLDPQGIADTTRLSRPYAMDQNLGDHKQSVPDRSRPAPIHTRQVLPCVSAIRSPPRGRRCGVG